MQSNEKDRSRCASLVGSRGDMNLECGIHDDLTRKLAAFCPRPSSKAFVFRTRRLLLITTDYYQLAAGLLRPSLNRVRKSIELLTVTPTDPFNRLVLENPENPRAMRVAGTSITNEPRFALCLPLHSPFPGYFLSIRFAFLL